MAETASGALEAGPGSTYGFGPRESADETRQAQHALANDAPVDVNFNAIVARSQALTVDAIGKNFEANGDLRQKLQDRILAKLPA